MTTNDKRAQRRKALRPFDLDNSSRGGTRTPDRVINSHLLYHLSYPGILPEAQTPEPQNFIEVEVQVKRGRVGNARMGAFV